MKNSTWTETLYDCYGQTLGIDEILYEDKSEHQHVLIFSNALFGRVLVLDGVVQTTERDEFIYHEMLTHVPLMAHGSVRRVLIIGGGDGGILREVCRHGKVDHVTQVEIDQAVIDMARKHLPGHSQGAFDDPRANIVIGDGYRFVQECEEKFDVIICDSTDPIGPGEVLFSGGFYESCKDCLSPGGVLVTQNGVAYMQMDEVLQTASRLGPLFADAHFYSAAIPTYIGGIMTFGWATDNVELRRTGPAVIAERWRDSGIRSRYYNPDIHQASFALPQYILEQLADINCT